MVVFSKISNENREKYYFQWTEIVEYTYLDFLS